MLTMKEYCVTVSKSSGPDTVMTPESASISNGTVTVDIEFANPNANTLLVPCTHKTIRSNAIQIKPLEKNNKYTN